MRPFSSLARCLAASFLMDGAFYLTLTAVPLRACELHATPVQLGLFPLLSSAVYIAAALFFGHLSDRFSRLRLAGLGALLRAGLTLGLIVPQSVTGLMIWMPLIGISNGLFWPALQAKVGELRPPSELGTSLGRFNISWSFGKMLGFVLGGVVIARFDYRAALGLSSLFTILVPVILPHGRAERSSSNQAPRAAQDLVKADQRWRWIGWLANFVLFGVGATLNYQYPKLMVSMGFNGRDFGVFLGGIYLFQTLTFAGLGRWSGWHFRLWPLLIAQGIAAVSVLCLTRLHSLPWIFATAPGIGLGLGMSYSSSIYYSLFRQSGPGRSSGIHEALLGTGTFLLPLAGGAAAQWTGSLIAPYFVCVAMLAAAMVAEGVLKGSVTISPGRHDRSTP